MIKRICLQGSGFNEWVYLDKEDMRLGLCDLHEPDWTGTEIDSNGKEVEKDIFTLTFEEICEYGDWGYQELTSKEEENA
jgi:hypothetical protein